MNRFSQKDILRGSITEGTSLNRYLFCQNDPINYSDPSGMRQVEGNSPNSDSVRRVVQTNNSANTKAAEQRAAAQRAAAQRNVQEKKIAERDARVGNPKGTPNPANANVECITDSNSQSCGKKETKTGKIKGVLLKTLGKAEYISQSNEVLSPPTVPVIFFYAVEGYKYQSDILVDGDDTKPIVVYDKSYGSYLELGIAFSGENGGAEISFNIQNGLSLYFYSDDGKNKDYFSITISLNNLYLEKGNSTFTDGIEETVFNRTYITDPNKPVGYIIDPIIPAEVPIYGIA